MAFGAENSASADKNLAAVQVFASRLDVIPFDEGAAFHYGDIRSALTRKGRAIGPYDLMIGAHARSRALILVTQNTREFARIEGLRLENWL